VNLFLCKCAEHSEDEVKKNLLETKCMRQFSVRIISETFFALMNILARFTRDARSSSNRHSCKVFIAVARCKRI
jgi:hypothetical protein